MDETTSNPIVNIALDIAEPIIPIQPLKKLIIPTGGQLVDNSKDKQFSISEIELQKTVSEKSLEDYVYTNAKKLWKELFSEDVKKVTRQYAEISGVIQISKNNVMPKRGVRVDLYIECVSGSNYIVEIKNPKYGQFDTINAIGKILLYSVVFPNANRLVILSTLYEPVFKDVITKYALPIDFVLFAKDKVYLLKK